MRLLRGIVFFVFFAALQPGHSTPVMAMAIQCHLKKAPRISVMPSNSRIQYDFTKSKAALDKVDVDTVSPYGPHHKTYVSGLMSGAISIRSRIAFAQEIYENIGVGCTYVKSVEVTLHVDPTIFIASEYPRGSCMHQAILDHELKHVREDQLIINKYAAILDTELSQKISRLRHKYEPVLIADIKDLQNDVQEQIHDVVRDYNSQLNQERQQRQQAIDTLEEYESIGRRCQGSKKGRYTYVAPADAAAHRH